MDKKNQHSADDAALGFLYQGQYALFLLWRETDDDSVVYLETLDDVVLQANGTTILEQLKHSMAVKPPALTLTSVNLWKTLKAWIDVFPQLSLSQTWLHLVTVAEISSGSSLEVLLTDAASRDGLRLALEGEANRVLNERAEAKAKGKTSLPHETRAAACEAFLALGQPLQDAMLSRTRIKPGQKNILEIEGELAKSLTAVVKAKREQVAQYLVEWWNRQILLAMAGARSKAITRFELVSKHMEIVADITLDKLIDSFSGEIPPNSYQSHPKLHEQIALVDGTEAEVGRAVRDEWRARENRSRWSNENPTRRELIARHDDHLAEEWADRHADLCAGCGTQPDDMKKKGHDLLVWSHYEAHKAVNAIDSGVTKPSYIRGSYQVLSIDGRVGWHPEYRKLLGFRRMILAHDLFAEANPAFGTFLAVGFCKAYVSASESPPALALLFLALPIALSQDMESSFSATNAATGLLAWLNRYPDVRLELGSRLDASKPTVSSAVRFAIGSRALALNEDGTIVLGSAAPPISRTDSLPQNAKGAVRRAQRLGTWMGKAGSTASVFSAFGVVP